MVFTDRHMQKPNRTLLPKSPFTKGDFSYPELWTSVFYRQSVK
jgi:hypothetical protein